MGTASGWHGCEKLEACALSQPVAVPQETLWKKHVWFGNATLGVQPFMTLRVTR